ncbi:MAG: DUF1189 domain-containing protein [Clostridium sp.]|nr:DUF1189 domain-containing protein [Clostridium sp.]
MEDWEQEEQNSTMENIENMKLSECFMTAMFSPKEYSSSLLKLPVKKMVRYFLCLILLLTVIRNVIPMLGAIAGMGGFRNIISERIPDFELENGSFSMVERIEIDDEQSGVYILIDTDVDRFTEEDVDVKKGVLETVLVGRTNMLVSNTVGGIGTMNQEYKFSDFGDLQMTKQTLIDMVPFYYMMMFFVFIGQYLAMGIKYMLSALCYAVFIYFFIIKMLSVDHEFGEVYQTAMYAKTMGAVVEEVSYCIGSPLLIMAGSIFHVFITMMLMNRVYVGKTAV